MQSDDQADAMPSSPTGVHGAGEIPDPAVEGEGSEHLSTTPRVVPTPPMTGDPVVDAAMADLAAAEDGPLSERIDAGVRAHRVLQERLDDLNDRTDQTGRGHAVGTPGPGGR